MLNWLKDNLNKTRPEIMAALDMPDSTVRRYLTAALNQYGAVQRSGDGSKSNPYRYRLKDGDND